MKAKDLFGLAVRILGLVFLYHVLSALPGVIVAVLGGDPIRPVLFMFAWPLLVAYWFLRGAPLLMRLAYPDANLKASEGGPLKQTVEGKPED